MSVIYGHDGADVQKVLVDAQGHLQVDVLSGGTSGAQYDFGDEADLADAGVPHKGTAILAVRKDADTVTTLLSSQGQYSELTVGSRGELYCSKIQASLTNDVVNIVDIDEVVAEAISTNGTCIKSMYLFNRSADTPIWLKVYNAAAGNVTPGTTAPNLDILVGPNSSRHFEFSGTDGVIFDVGLSVSASTTSGTTAVGTINDHDLSGVFIISAYT